MGKSVWARESRDRNIWIFAGIAALAFLLTVASYETGFFRLEPIHSDGNGYYMYLPAVFVYHDPGMHFVEHLPEDISGFSGTFFTKIRFSHALCRSMA